MPASTMKNLYPFLFIAALGAVQPAAAAPNPFALKEDENAGIEIHESGALVFPASMVLSGVHFGEARVAISVDAEGRLTDSLLIGYTDIAFGRAATEAVKRWTYGAALVHGRPRAACAEVLFIFKNDVVSASSGTTNATRQLIGILQEHYEYKPCLLRDLDRIPTPLHVVAPVPPRGNSHRRDVTVDFYVDEEGKVRVPTVSRDDADDACAAAAVAAVEQWSFEPPLRKGQPALVLLKQEFSFRAKP